MNFKKHKFIMVMKKMYLKHGLFTKHEFPGDIHEYMTDRIIFLRTFDLRSEQMILKDPR